MGDLIQRAIHLYPLAENCYYGVQFGIEGKYLARGAFITPSGLIRCTSVLIIAMLQIDLKHGSVTDCESESSEQERIFQHANRLCLTRSEWIMLRGGTVRKHNYFCDQEINKILCWQETNPICEIVHLGN